MASLLIGELTKKPSQITIVQPSINKNELRSFRTKVDLPDGIRQDLSQFARWHTTLYNKPIRDVILLKFEFHAYGHYLFTLVPFFRLERRQMHIWRIAVWRTNIRAKRPHKLYLIIFILRAQQCHQERATFTRRGVLIKHTSLDDLLINIKLVPGCRKNLLFNTVHCHQPQYTHLILLPNTMGTILSLQILKIPKNISS